MAEAVFYGCGCDCISPAVSVAVTRGRPRHAGMEALSSVGLQQQLGVCRGGGRGGKGGGGGGEEEKEEKEEQEEGEKEEGKEEEVEDGVCSLL